MKQYIVKIINTATAGNPIYSEGEQQTWFIGKGGESRRQIKWLPNGGWSRRCYAEQYIRKCQEYSEELKLRGGEHWTKEYEVVEVEA